VIGQGGGGKEGEIESVLLDGKEEHVAVVLGGC
jgi:hypothetical protein